MSYDRNNSNSREEGYPNWKWIVPLTSLALVGGAAFLLSKRFKVSSPSQYIVKTGLGIRDMNIAKTTFLFPFQEYRYIEMTPHNYGFELRAMTNEKLEFKLPVLFTIGAKDDMTSLKQYSRYIGSPGSIKHDDHHNHLEKVTKIIQGIIEGETRVLAASMSIEDIFKSRSVFKEQIVAKVQEELDKFGLVIYNSNIKELQDVEGSEYFGYLRQKTVEGANNQGIIDVSEARMKGAIGEKERTGKTRQEVARIESQTVVTENNLKAEIIDSEVALEIKRAKAEREKNIAHVEASQATAFRQAELEADVNQAKTKEQTERLRSELLSMAQVRAESAIKEAEGKMEAAKREADALLYQKQKQAEGELALLEAQATGLRKIVDAVGGNTEHLMQYLMLEKRVYQELASENAKAIRGLNPQITVWHTDGNGSGSGSSPLKTITDLYKALPPVLSSVEQMTGMKPPSWLVSEPPKTPNVKTTPDLDSVSEQRAIKGENETMDWTSMALDRTSPK